MIINKIALKNFYRYGNNEQTIDMTGTGITAIVGLNGYGKSTSVIDSLLFAFYGKYRCNTIDGVVNRYTGKDCKVAVEFTEGGDNYKVIRYRKHTTHNNNVYIFKNDKDISGHTAAETNNIIIDTIKMNHIAFTNSAVFSSELYSAFLANKVSERLVVFENILSLKEINVFYAATKDIIKDLTTSLDEEKLSKSSIESEINTLENTITVYSSNAKQKLISMKNEKENYKKQIVDLKEKVKEYSIVDIDGEKRKLSNKIIKDELFKRINLLNKEKAALFISKPVEELRIVDKYKDINFEENRLKELKYKEDLETIKARENGYNLENEKINSLTQKQGSLLKEKEGYINESNELNKRIENLKKSVCPFCGQHLTSEKSEEELNNANNRLKTNINSIKEIDSELNNIELELQEARENYNYLISDYNNLKNKLDKNFIPNSDLVEQQYNSALKTIRECEEKMRDNASRTIEIDDELTELNKKYENISVSNYTEEELNSLTDKIKEKNDLILDIEKKIAGIDSSAKNVFDKSYVDGLKKNKEDKEKELTKVVEKCSEIDNELKHYSYLSECFSNRSGGFKKYFIGEMIELFNDKINQYLPFFFSEDVKIKFDKDLNDKITMDGFEVDFNSFSQGQRQRSELAIAFALFDVARVFFSNDNKLLLLDEMDKGLDKIGIKSMINLLNGFDSQLKIFIVSHNPLVEEEIPNKITISRDENGFSKIA